MTSAQVRAARGLLNWTVRDLAERAGVHRNTVTNIETERYGGSADALTAIGSAFEKAGVEFIPENGGGVGVRLRRSYVDEDGEARELDAVFFQQAKQRPD
ncbi:MAG: helix-turn-helix transcriptional regulator [Pseudomonadota bacterium]